MNQPLVSIIMATRNREHMLRNCLESIRKQTYENIEIILVDGNSIDNTKSVALEYTDKFFVFDKQGDHRCAQRNLGIEKASGEYVLLLDDDMELSPDVVKACIETITGNPKIKAIKIPEESFGKGFWAQCKKLEKSFYVGVDWIEAARFFEKKVFEEVGGYDETLTSGEDWDLSEKIEAKYTVSRVKEFIRHNEGEINLFSTLKKKNHYSSKFKKYTDKKPGRNPYWIVIRRFLLFFSHPIKLFKNPVLGIGMIFMKTCEYLFGALGYYK